MRRFRFRLATALRLRAHAFDGALAELRRAEDELRHAESLRQGHESRARASVEWVDARAAAGLPSGELAACRRGLTDLFAELRRVEQVVERARERVRDARARAQEARRELRTLETLRERALAEHRRAEWRLEQAELDEVAARRAGGLA